MKRQMKKETSKVSAVSASFQDSGMGGGVTRGGDANELSGRGSERRIQELSTEVWQI